MRLVLPESSTRIVALGGAMAVAGLVMMGGWLFEMPSIVGALPGFRMVFATAFGFFVAGTGLVAGAAMPQWRTMTRTATGLALAALGTLVLAQFVLGISVGIDAPGWHAWFADPNPNPWPGRASPATGATFIIAGAVFLLCPWADTLPRAVLVRALTAALALFGALAIAGDRLNLSELLDSYALVQVALPTAVGFMALALGLWMSWDGEAWATQRLIDRDDDRIALAGAAILAVSIAFAGAAIFGLMKASVERVLTANLSYTSKVRQASIVDAIERAARETASVAQRPGVERVYRALGRTPRDPADDATLLSVANGLMGMEFSAFAFYDAEGRELARAGEFINSSPLRMPLARAAGPVELQWDGHFALRTRAMVVVESRRLGEVRGQHRMPELDAAVADTGDLGATSEYALCASVEGWLQCAPTRLQPRPFAVLTQAGERLPMSHALDGETGVRKLTDYRGKRVLAAHAPLGTYGIGTVLKTDIAEFFDPIRDRLAWLALIMLLASAGGGWLLRSQVQPLVRRLLHSKEQLHMALEGSRLALWDWDIPAGTIHLGEQWAALLGGTPQPMDTTPEALLGLIHPDDLEMVRSNVTSLLRGTSSHYSMEHRVRTNAGEWKWIRSRGRICERTPDGRAVRAVGTNVDISERKHQQLQTTHRANHDALTGLPNRSLFHDRLERALERSLRTGALLALLYIDVDKFKAVNDTLGHAAGDAVLLEFARRLSQCVRAADTVARLGGDEFAVVLEGLTTREDGLRVADKIVLAMRAAFRTGESSASVSASVGIAFHEGRQRVAPKELVDAADRALYEAKAAGRDGFRAAA